MAVGIGPGHFKAFFNRLGGIIFHNSLTQPGKSGIVIPAHRNMWKIGNGIIPPDFFPFLLHIRKDVLIVPVNIRNMHKLVMSNAGKTKEGADITACFCALFVQAGKIGHAAVRRQLQVKPFKSGFYCFFPEPVQRVPGIFQTAQPVDQNPQFINLKNRFPVYLVIIGLYKILMDYPAADPLKFLPVYAPFQIVVSCSQERRISQV